MISSTRFSIAGPPRTKKTSNRIIQIKGKNGGRGFTKILPSEAHEEWFKVAMTQAPLIQRDVRSQGWELPLAGEINVKALFYRDRLSGDLTGFMQALADFLQEPKNGPSGKRIRNGAGIIRDDAQIAGWDGSRLRKDAAAPRIEVEITIVGPAQGELGLEEEW